MDRHNLFQFATNTFSHVAFWAWILQASDSDEKDLEAPKGVGQSAIRLLDGPIPSGPVEVTTDGPLSSPNQPDLRIDFGGDHSLFLELKKDTEFDSSQIEEYREAIGEEDQVGLISTHFDADEADGTCPFLSLRDIRELLWPHRDEHPLLADYADWADARKERWKVIEYCAFGDNVEEVTAALSTLYGQTLVMEAVTDSMSGEMRRTPSNRSGDPQTEFCFATSGSNQDALFYRLDEYTAGHHLSLKQHLDSRDAAAWDDKENRLKDLRTWWQDAVEETDHRLTFREPHNNGTKTREVACLLFEQNPSSVVAEDLPRIHDAFTSTLADNAWNLGVASD